MNSSKIFYSVFFLIYTTIILFAQFLMDFAYASSDLMVIPPMIEVKVTDNQLGHLLQRTLQITSYSTNITNVKAQFSDLQSNDINKVWMPRTAIQINPKAFNITLGQISELDLLINLPNQTGIYNGTMKLSSNQGILKTIPITINISQTYPIFYLSLVALGVAIAFIVKYMKLRIQERDAALDSLDQLEIAATNARFEERFDQRFNEGIDEVTRGLDYLKKGEYSQAKRIFDRASDYFRSATKQDTAGLLKQFPKKTTISDLVDEARTEKGLRSSFRQSDNLLFTLSSVILGVIIMQTWVQIYPQLITLGNTGIAAISAFVLGYGSQSLLGEVVELAKNR